MRENDVGKLELRWSTYVAQPSTLARLARLTCWLGYQLAS